MRLTRGAAGPVAGPTDHVVVIGAGLAGLSAALRLAGAGRSVTILERAAIPGGRAGLIEDSGYRFDTGPTVLTRPALIADALACVGEELADWLHLAPVTPVCRAFFPDGSQLDVHSDLDAMADEIAVVIGPREAAGYRRWVEFATTVHKLAMANLVDRNIDSPLDLLTPDLARLAAIGGFRRMTPTVNRYLEDPRTRRVFSLPSRYFGMSPTDAVALNSVSTQWDTATGVFFPKGGMHAVPAALAGAATKHGVTIRYSTPVASIEHDGHRASAVVTADGDRIPADVIVANPDLPVAYRDLLGIEPWSVRRLRHAPSCAVLLAGSTASYSRIAHNNIHFGRSRDPIYHGGATSDPSLLLSNPSQSDPSLAPEGRATYSALFPTPNLDDPIDWTRRGPAFRDHMVGVLEERGYVGFGDALEVEHLTTPLDWAARGMERGSPFAAAPTLGQTGPFRPGNRWGANVVFAGSGTRPGAGIPLVLISGRIAAERIVGALPRSQSR